MPDERIVHVPYVRFDVGPSANVGGASDMQGVISGALEGIAAALNVQFGSSGNAPAPLVWPEGMSRKSSRRLALYGIGGCGKTRCLFELVRSKLEKKKEKPAAVSVYVINPKGLPEDAAGRTYLAGILGRCGRGDIVVWDNFPEGLEKMNAENARLALKMLASSSSSRGHAAYVSPGPEYIEKNGVGALHGLGLDVVHLAYNRQDIKRLLSSYGRRLLAPEYFAAAITTKHELGAIADALWEIEPTPAAVIDYVQELGRSGGVATAEDGGRKDALAVAKKFVRRSVHFEQQFGILKGAGRRRAADVHFLLTLELCHELGLGRRLEQVAGLQERIFATRPAAGVLDRLQLWLYVSPVQRAGEGKEGRRIQISIHDTARRAIAAERGRDPRAARKMISFLARNYTGLIPAGDQSAYLFGSFVGRNCLLARAGDLEAFLPPENKQGRVAENDHYDVRSRRFYQIGLGHGIGRMLGSSRLGPRLLKKVFASAATNSQFGRNLGEGIGWEIVSMPPALCARAFGFARRNLIFSRGLGMGIGMNMPRLPSHIKKDVFLQAERNAQLADGLGVGAGTIIEFMPPEDHVWLFRTAESNPEFARGLGTGLAHSFVSLSESIQLYAMSLISQNPQFARGLGMGFGDAYPYLPAGLQKRAVATAGRNPEFAAGHGIGMGYSFSYLTGMLQEMILNMAQKNPSFAYGAGLGIGFTQHYLEQKVQRAMMDRAQANHRFAVGMGEGFGLSFALLPEQWRGKVMAAMVQNTSVALGFGMGIGYAYDYLGRDVQKRMWALAEGGGKGNSNNSQFAEGFGYGLGRTFGLHGDERLKRKILSMAEVVARRKNGESLAFGAGHGLGFSYIYLPQETRDELFRLATRRGSERFAAGFGWGLGTMFGYYSDAQQERIFAECVRDDGASESPVGEWVRKGMVEVWQYLDEADREYAHRLGALAQAAGDRITMSEGKRSRSNNNNSRTD